MFNLNLLFFAGYGSAYFDYSVIGNHYLHLSFSILKKSLSIETVTNQDLKTMTLI